MKRVSVVALVALASALGGIAGAWVTSTPPSVGADVGSVPPPAPYPEPTQQQTAELAGRTPIQADAMPAKREGLFFPVTPCRVIDSRIAGGPIGPNSSKDYYVSDDFGFPAQGGKAGGCGVPANATAVAVSIVAFEPTVGGFFTAWPTGSTRPLASTLNFVRDLNTNTGATFTIRPGSGKHLSIYNQQGTSGVIVDVTGYYAPQMQAQITAAGIITNGSSRVLSATRVNNGYYAVTWDTDVTRCAVQVTTFGFGTYASQPQLVGSTAYVYLWSLNATAIPQLTNNAFRMSVTC